MTKTTTIKSRKESYGLPAGIPYIKELKKIDGIKSVNACILMKQLEENFKQNPKGFCMYALTPKSELALYSKGRSWAEILGMSRSEIETAYSQMGVSYSSTREFKEAESEGDIFKGKYYCRVYRRSSGTNHQTIYYRNHQKMDEAIKIVTGD